MTRPPAPAASRPPAAVAYGRVQVLAPESTRLLHRGTLIVAAVIAIAVVKPWGEQPAAEVPAPAVIAALPSRAPQPPPDPIERICHNSTSWRVASAGLSFGSRMREWGFVTPVAAAGPTDPAIPFVIFAYSTLHALGYCAPTDVRPAADLEVRVYRINDTGAGMVAIAREELTPVTSVAGLFAPVAPPTGPGGPAGQAGPEPSWGPGRYVFALTGEPLGNVWFGAEIRGTTPANS